MTIQSLLKACRFIKTSVAAVSAASNITTGEIIDLGSPTLGGCDSVLLIASLGAVTNGGVVTLKAYTGEAAALGDGAYETDVATVTATAVAAFADNNLLILDLIRPGKRYVRADLFRETQAAVLDGIIAIPYNAKNQPTAQGTGVAQGSISVN